MIARGLLLLAIVWLLAGCGTVVQAPVASSAPSFDGNAQDSGILAKTERGYVVTAHFRDRYNALVKIYGASKTTDGSPIFTPPLKPDDGFSAVDPVTARDLYGVSSAWLVDYQAMGNMAVMSALKRRGFQP